MAGDLLLQVPAPIPKDAAAMHVVIMDEESSQHMLDAAVQAVI